MYRHYVPILKSKLAELDSVRGLSPAIKQNISPLLELIPVPWDFPSNKPKMSLKEHLDKSASKINKAWGSDLRFFLDLVLLDSTGKIAGLHPLEYIFNELTICNVIPTTGLTQVDDYQQAVANIIAKDKKGICLRVKKEDIEDMLELSTTIDNVLHLLNTSTVECDLVLDLENLPLGISDSFLESILDVIEFFPYLKEWRSFTLAASSFPVILEIQQNDDKLLPRYELSLWRSVVANKATLPRLPSFGDYAIQHPDLSDLDFRFIKSSVNLRYATDEFWLVYKAREKVRHGFDQFNDICRLLLKRKEYSGSDYSWGDGYIKRCADNKDGPGNPTTWRKAGFSHHITLTANLVVLA